MTGAFNVPKGLAPDWHSLQRLLDRYPYTQVPCRASLQPAHWVADSAEVQRAAAVECSSCPGFAQCREYGLAHPKESGVYGGLTEQERSK